LEQSFRDWTEAARREDVRISRRRILLIFLLIRYTGAKLSEVLGLDLCQDIDFEGQYVRFGRMQKKTDRARRKVQLPERLCREIQALINASSFKSAKRNTLSADPGFVRRKFYERAQACGIAKQLGAPETLRKSRAIELMQNNMPLPAVQMLLGHSTPNLTSSYVSFSEDDIQQITRLFFERESARKTSARNAFFGKIQTIRRGDIEACVRLATIGGYAITTVITIDSLERLALRKGRLITAEVKAPWVILQQGEKEPSCSAENRFHGSVSRITAGEVNTEYIVRIFDGSELCAVVSTAGSRQLNLEVGDPVWAMFNCFAVVLHID
jgi:molybdate transport system regulatory protein